jgi:hypothetical protein
LARNDVDWAKIIVDVGSANARREPDCHGQGRTQTLGDTTVVAAERDHGESLSKSRLAATSVAGGSLARLVR